MYVYSLIFRGLFPYRFFQCFQYTSLCYSVGVFWIRDITPIRIDLDGDWIFSISDKDGDRLCYLNNKAMMRIL